MNVRIIESMLVVAGLTAAASGQTTWHVDDDACPAPGSGTELDPFCSIQVAIAAAADGDEIVVAPGTYGEAIDLLGKAVHLRSSDGRDVTTIDATGLGTSVVRLVGGEGPDTLLEGFTITGGTGSDLAGFLAGGGIMVWDGSPHVRACTIEDNTAELGGGVMTFALHVETQPTFTDCRLVENEAWLGQSDTGWGGGAYNVPSSGTIANAPTFVDCQFERNLADSGGGGAANNGSQATYSRCRFIDNESRDIAGGMHNGTDSTVALDNCLFGGNTAATYGGAMVNGGAGPSATTALCCTIMGNEAPIAGAIRNDAGSILTLSTSIVWANTGDQIVNDGGSSSLVTYCDVQGGHPGDGNIDLDPQCDADGRLQAGSPCIDAGNVVAVPGQITDDVDGAPRFVNDPCTADTGNPDGVRAPIDMGAYEFQPPCRADLDCSGGVGFPDLLVLLSAWGPCGGCVHDIDGSGGVDFGDLLQTLSAWGPCE
jgi:hypothetical protein